MRLIQSIEENVVKTKFFKQTTRKVPKGFQEVEYLESTGTQYIDTGYIPNQDTKVELGYKITRDLSTGFPFFGSRTSASADGFSYQRYGSGYLGGQYGSNVTYSTVTPDTSRHTVIRDKNKIYLDGTEIISQTYTTFTCPSSLYINAMNNNGTVAVQNCNVVYYYVKVWNNGTLVRDFVPYLDASGRPCMWDMVEGKPYYNQGTGEFTYGRKIIPVEYLESTGTQYIDTNYAFTDNFSWEIDFEGISDGTTLFGGRTSSTRTALLYQRNYGGIDKTTCPIAGYNGQETPFQLDDLRVGRHVIKMSVASNKGSVWVDGTQVYNETSFTGSYISGITQAVFADKFGANDYREQTSSKVYGLKMLQSSTLVRDYIPAIDENNVPYMFDKVTHSAFLNAGTGNFLYGDIVKERTETLRVLPIIRHLPLNYLESTGTQYIDTGYIPNQDTKVECKLYNPTDFNISKQGSILFGARDYGTLPTFTVIGNILNKYGTRWDYGDSVLEKLDFPLTVGEHSIIKDKQYNYLDGVLVVTNITSTFSIGYTMHIFGTNTNGTNTLPFVGKYYYFKIYNDGVLIRDFIPVLKLPERIPCMYDKVSKTYFYNAGTGNFLYGFN